MKRYEIQWDKLRPRLPFVWVRNKDRVVPNAPDDAVAVYQHDFNRIIIKAGCDNWGIRFHEYGHWLFATAYDFLDEAWEVLWWHFRVRQLFVNPRAWWLNMFQRPADAHRVMILESVFKNGRRIDNGPTIPRPNITPTPQAVKETHK